MKRFVFVSGLLLTLLLAVACSGSPEPAAVESKDEPQIEPVTAVEEKVDEKIEKEIEKEIEEEIIEESTEVDLSDPAVVEEAKIAIEAAGLVHSTDFSQISQTGRPQFLNSYANW